MLGKTIYKAVVVNNKVKIQSAKITYVGRTVCKFDKKIGIYNHNQCHKSDIGVVIFLTKKEALDYIIKELRHFIDMGIRYLENTRKNLESALKLQK